MSGQYAKRTTVPVSKSKMDIERLLERYGATGFLAGWQGTHEAIGFTIGQLRVQMTIERDDEPQKHRQQWRALGLVVKAKLEAVESGISTIEQEFLAWVVCPNGQTIGQAIMPQLERIANEGVKLPLLTAS